MDFAPELKPPTTSIGPLHRELAAFLSRESQAGRLFASVAGFETIAGVRHDFLFLDLRPPLSDGDAALRSMAARVADESCEGAGNPPGARREA